MHVESEYVVLCVLKARCCVVRVESECVVLLYVLKASVLCCTC